LNLGAGLKYDLLRIDYGLDLYGELGLVHRMQISVIFPEPGLDKTDRADTQERPEIKDLDVIEDLLEEEGAGPLNQTRTNEQEKGPGSD
jgi:hypothetical protein